MLRKRRHQRSRAFSLIEMLIVTELVMVLAGMMLPNVQVSRKAANEASAVACLRQISDAQELYRPRQNPPEYAPNLQRLRVAGLIDENLANEEKGGYRFIQTLRADQNSFGYTAIASMQGTSGDRSFFVDQTGLIRMESDASVSYVSPPLQ